MKKFPALFFLLFLLASCAEEETPQRPDYVLTEERFAELLVNMTLAESAANLNIKNVIGRHLDSVYAFDPLREMEISEAVYDSTIRFYARHPALYKKVYNEVLSRLSALESARNSKVGKAAK